MKFLLFCTPPKLMYCKCVWMCWFLWRKTAVYKSDCAIFHELSVAEIISEASGIAKSINTIITALSSLQDLRLENSHCESIQTHIMCQTNQWTVSSVEIKSKKNLGTTHREWMMIWYEWMMRGRVRVACNQMAVILGHKTWTCSTSEPRSNLWLRLLCQPLPVFGSGQKQEWNVIIRYL